MEFYCDVNSSQSKFVRFNFQEKYHRPDVNKMFYLKHDIIPTFYNFNEVVHAIHYPTKIFDYVKTKEELQIKINQQETNIDCHKSYEQINVLKKVIQQMGNQKFVTVLKSNKMSTKFQNLNLIWFSPAIKSDQPEEYWEQNTKNELGCYYNMLVNNPFKNKYGSILIKTPLENILNENMNACALGTREFKLEVNHSIILSPYKTNYYYIVDDEDNHTTTNKLPQINPKDCEILKYENDTQDATWKCTRNQERIVENDQENFRYDSLDFGFDANEVYIWDFKLDFVSHDWYSCPKSNRCGIQRKEAKRQFKKITSQKSVFEDFKPFLTDEDYDDLKNNY